ncbi:tail fiber assembly protein [Enterobacter sp. PTB]|uniref:tail fiber assembly protein n=1 Tax=Enterobacter sp. PTB TaxID=3143437 RepID=UPI003DA7B3C4
MAIFYSAASNSFYPDELKEDYEANGSWPADALEISDAEHQSLLEGASSGMLLQPDENGKPSLREPAIDYVQQATGEQRSLIAEAKDIIAPLQDAVDLGIETDEEREQLTAWKKYRVLLGRVNPEYAPDITWPEPPDINA